MITGEVKSKVDRIWDAFWSGGISNPIEVIEQITYLLFLRRLDELQDLKEQRANLTGQPIVDPIFNENQQSMRWKTLKNAGADTMFQIVQLQVFPFLQNLGHQIGGESNTYGQHMKGARFTIPSAAMLSKVVDLLDKIPMEDRDTNGDLYEYLLSKLSSAGVNGQFRTPRHIIQMMVELMAPTSTDTICDPACGTAGFLVAASEYVREKRPESLTDARLREHYQTAMFTGFDFDSTMLRIGSMNMLMHGIPSANIAYRDSLSKDAEADASQYSLILANPPFAGSLDAEQASDALQKVVKTKKTELLFLALFLRLLSTGGRAAVIVPDGVLFGSSKAHKDLRQKLVEEQKLEAVIKLPSGVFRPYAGVSTAILIFTKTESGGTDHVWFYDVRTDGFSLDDKRNPISENDLPDVVARFAHKDDDELTRARTEQSFCVPKSEIVEQSYDLSLNRYKEIQYDEVEHRAPLDIIADIEKLDAEIAEGMVKLKAMLS